MLNKKFDKYFILDNSTNLYLAESIKDYETVKDILWSKKPRFCWYRKETVDKVIKSIRSKFGLDVTIECHFANYEKSVPFNDAIIEKIEGPCIVRKKIEFQTNYNYIQKESFYSEKFHSFLYDARTKDLKVFSSSDEAVALMRKIVEGTLDFFDGESKKVKENNKRLLEWYSSGEFYSELEISPICKIYFK